VFGTRANARMAQFVN